MNERRGFLKTVVVGIIGLLGFKTVTASESNDLCTGFEHPAMNWEGPTFAWCKASIEQMNAVLWESFNMQRHAGQWPGNPVGYSSVHCGAGTCPPGPEEEGFRAIITMPLHTYHIVVKPNYLGCVMSNRFSRKGEDWLRGRDLADGKRTAETMDRIYADIYRIEKAECA